MTSAPPSAPRPGARGSWKTEALRLRAELDKCQRDNAMYKACANGYALSALRALMDMTGSANWDNPWLGVIAAVALLQARPAGKEGGADA